MSLAYVNGALAPSPTEQAFAAEYDQVFVAFIRKVVGQGVPVTDRAMEGAHELATPKAIAACHAKGYRTTDFAPLTKAGLARMRLRYGY